MRTLQHQLQDLADWLAGIDVNPKPTGEQFSAGALRAAWRAIADQPWQGDATSYRELCCADMRPAMMGYPNGLALYQRITRVIPSSVEHPFPTLAELAEALRPVDWLWPGWLPAGMLTLLAARPGVGKSILALDLAGRLVTAAPWPDGAPACRPASNVIYVDAENIPEVHNERAVAWDLPREKLYLLLPDEADVLVDLGAAKYQELLVQMVYRLEPALVIVDSLGAAMCKGENAVEDVRGVLGFLAGLSQHHQVGVLIIHHLRKAGAGQLPTFETIDPDQIRGSGHITAMSRVVWGLSQVQTAARPDPNGPRKLQVIKSTLARHPRPLGVTLEPVVGGGAASDGCGELAASGHVRVAYDVKAPEPYRPPTERDAAAEWLVEYLEGAGKPVAPKAVIEAGQVAGFSRAVLYRARESLNGEVVNTGGRRSAGNCWRLATTEAV